MTAPRPEPALLHAAAGAMYDALRLIEAQLRSRVPEPFHSLEHWVDHHLAHATEPRVLQDHQATKALLTALRLAGAP